MTQDILTAEQVAEIRRRAAEPDQGRAGTSTGGGALGHFVVWEEVVRMSGSHELLRAENKRLRRLIQQADHKSNCAIYKYSGEECLLCGIGKVHAKSAVCSNSSTPHEWVLTPTSDCDCFKSKVTP